MPPAQLKNGLPILANPANRKKALALTEEQFRSAFGNAVSAAEARELYERWSIPSPARPLFQSAFASFTPHSAAEVDRRRSDRGPLLLVGVSEDATEPTAITRSTHRLYRDSHAVTDYVEIAGRGHSLTIDAGWREVADQCLDWLSEQGFGPDSEVTPLSRSRRA